MTVPVEILRFFRLSAYEKVVFEKEAGKVVVKKARDFLSLKGALKSKKEYDDEVTDKSVGSHIAKEYAKKITRTGH